MAAAVTCAANKYTGNFPSGERDFWVGNYECRQGKTAMIIEFTEKSAEDIEGVFLFAHRTGAGSIRIKGRYSPENGELMFRAVEWIQKPGPTWVLFEGPISGAFTDNGEALEAEIDSPGCGDLEARRQTGPDAARSAFYAEATAVGLAPGAPRYRSAIERGGFTMEGLGRGAAGLAGALSAACSSRSDGCQGDAGSSNGAAGRVDAEKAPVACIKSIERFTSVDIRIREMLNGKDSTCLKATCGSGDWGSCA